MKITRQNEKFYYQFAYEFIFEKCVALRKPIKPMTDIS